MVTYRPTPWIVEKIFEHEQVDKNNLVVDWVHGSLDAKTVKWTEDRVEIDLIMCDEQQLNSYKNDLWIQRSLMGKPRKCNFIQFCFKLATLNRLKQTTSIKLENLNNSS